MVKVSAEAYIGRIEQIVIKKDDAESKLRELSRGRAACPVYVTPQQVAGTVRYFSKRMDEIRGDE